MVGEQLFFRHCYTRNLYLALLAVILTVSISRGGIIYVNTCGNNAWSGQQAECIAPDGPKLTIQAGIDAAVDGDTVLVADGVYKGPGNRDINFKGKAITLKSSGGYTKCMIDCEGTANNPHRAFLFNKGEGHDSILEGFSIFNGLVPDDQSSLGGGIKCNHSSPTIRDCYISQCSAGYSQGFVSASGDGGGLWCKNSDVIIEHCMFVGNYAFYGMSLDGNGCGGAIRIASNCRVVINRCEFYGNAAYIGAGVCGSSKEITITNCIFAANASTDSGGAIGVYTQQKGLIRMCLIQDNWAGNKGGGIQCHGANFMIKNCTVCGNSAYNEDFMATSYGGGIYCREMGDITILNCTIHANKVVPFGGRGGGIYCQNVNNTTIRNCIVWENDIEQITPGNPRVRYCDVMGGYPGTGNIHKNPLFVSPGRWHLQDWQPGNYHLQSEAGWWYSSQKRWEQSDATSPCIDAGTESIDDINDPNYVYGDWADELWPHGGRINMGTFGGTTQASWSLAQDIGNIADLNLDGQVNAGDFASFADKWMQTRSLLHADMNSNGTVDIDDLAILTAQWLWKQE